MISVAYPLGLICFLTELHNRSMISLKYEVVMSNGWLNKFLGGVHNLPTSNDIVGSKSGYDNLGITSFLH